MIKHPTLNFEIGCRIRDLREYRHYTREVLAEKADLSVTFLADIESGRKGMSVKTLKKLSQALQISTDYIVFGGCTPETDEDIPSRLGLLISKLTPTEQHFAEEILKLYMEALGTAKAREKEN